MMNNTQAPGICYLSSYSLSLGDIVTIHSCHKDRLVARTREYWEERIFLSHLPYILLVQENHFTFLGIDTCKTFVLCKWLCDGGIWFTCVHPNHAKFVTVTLLSDR